LSHAPTGSKPAEQRIEPTIASADGPVNARPLSRPVPRPGLAPYCQRRTSEAVPAPSHAHPRERAVLGSFSRAPRPDDPRRGAHCEWSFRTMIRTICILWTSRRRAAVLD
jgi:hypothetical protein